MQQERATEESDSDGEDVDAVPMDLTACTSVGSSLEPADIPAQVPKDRDSFVQHAEDMLFDLDDDASGSFSAAPQRGASGEPCVALFPAHLLLLRSGHPDLASLFASRLRGFPCDEVSHPGVA